MKKKLWQSTVCLLCGLLLVACCSLIAFGGAVDLSRSCSVTFRVISYYRPVPGGNIIITKVANIGGSSYVWIPELSPYPQQPVDINTFEESLSLYAYVQTKNLPTQERIINDRGEARFTDLEPGMYLYYQTIPASGYTLLPPFVFTLPQSEVDHWNYDPVLYPKPNKPTPDTTNPTNPTTPTTPTSPTTPSTPTTPGTPPVTTPTTGPFTTYPVDTTAPSTPTTPTSPTTPSTPTTPSDPNTPSKPDTPTEPTSPTEPTEPTGTTGPSKPTEPTKPEKPTKPGETTTAPDHSKTEPRTTTEKPEELPKTGQLKWPIPVLAGLGLALIGLGLLLRMVDRRKEDDT